MRFLRSLSVGILVFAVAATGNTEQCPPGPGPGLPETIEAIENARITTRILYITAHPDDESFAVLTYLARGLHSDVALLTLTRGEGGQNDLGPEQAPQLGLIRTQELLAATRGYGVQLFFTRARDFGFSKTLEETQRIWGHQVLEDMVRIIRTFRPNIVINHFGGVHSGHGHHQAAGFLTPKAVQLAADPAYKLGGAEDQKLGPWGDRKPVVLLDRASPEAPGSLRLPLDDISPLYGKSWHEIGLDAFANHRSQGITRILGSPFLRRPIALRREDGASLDPALLAQPLGPLDEDYEIGNMGVDPLMRTVDADLVAARDAALRLDWKAAAHSLVLAGKKLNEVPMPSSTYQIPAPVESLVRSVQRKRAKIDTALTLVAGLRLDALADRSEIVSGETFSVRVATHYRPDVNTDLNKPALEFLPDWSVVKEELDNDGSERFTVFAGQNSSAASRSKSRMPSSSAMNALLPEPPPLAVARQEADIEGYTFTVTSPVVAVRATSTRVDRILPRIVPAYTLALEPKQIVEALPKPPKPFDIVLRVHCYSTEPTAVTVGLDVPGRWKASAPVLLKFSSTGDRYAHLTVTPPSPLAAADYKIAAYAMRAAERSRSSKTERFTTSLEPLPTLPAQFWSEPAQSIVHAFPINVPPNLRVGYITAESEPVPDALRRLGIAVEMLDPATLAFGDLSRFSAIVVGVRAYELRADLSDANQRLLDYVSKGGTLIVQYQREFAWDRFHYAPYPAIISPPNGSPLPRITDENSPVRFLRPDDPLLNRPNKITQGDFQGWVQERALYFWSQFDRHYTPLLAMNDPGEPELRGALVYTRFGKGAYIYTGIAFFRQLPEGIPGAYRLFVNLISGARLK